MEKELLGFEVLFLLTKSLLLTARPLKSNLDLRKMQEFGFSNGLESYTAVPVSFAKQD
jgi:hypothetical protein